MKNYIKCIMVCLFAAFSLMSCNDDNNDRDLTPEEINSIINGFNGYYQGKLISATDYNADTQKFLQQDTIMTEAAFGLDTTVTFSGFPVTYLAKKIKSDGNAELKEALHSVTISFLQYYSFAQFYSSKVVMQLLPAAVYVDGNLAEDILQSSQAVDLAYSFNQV